MRTNSPLFSFLLLACIPSDTTAVINLPNRTIGGFERRTYDPCIKSYTQKTEYPAIEEHICVSNLGNTNVDEYFDTARDYPCTWQPTKDGKTRCIPAIINNYFSNMENGDWMHGEPNKCLDPIAQLEIDPFHHPRSRYVGLPDHKGKFSIYEVGERVGIYTVYTWHWDASLEAWSCISLLPIDLFYPLPRKGFDWYIFEREVDPAIFQER